MLKGLATGLSLFIYKNGPPLLISLLPEGLRNRAIYIRKRSITQSFPQPLTWALRTAAILRNGGSPGVLSTSAYKVRADVRCNVPCHGAKTASDTAAEAAHCNAAANGLTRIARYTP